MDDVILKFITSKPSIRYRIAMWCYTTLVVTRCLCRISCHTDDLSLRGTCCRACVKIKIDWIHNTQHCNAKIRSGIRDSGLSRPGPKFQPVQKSGSDQGREDIWSTKFASGLVPGCFPGFKSHNIYHNKDCDLVVLE